MTRIKETNSKYLLYKEGGKWTTNCFIPMLVHAHSKMFWGEVTRTERVQKDPEPCTHASLAHSYALAPFPLQPYCIREESTEGQD